MRSTALPLLAVFGVLSAAQALADERLFRDPSPFDKEFPPQMVEVSIPSAGEMLTGTWYTAAGTSVSWEQLPTQHSAAVVKSSA